MNPFCLSLTCALALAAGQNPDTPDRSSRPDDGHRRLEIYNGPYRSVHYFVNSPADADAYRALEHAENEAQTSLALQYLRMQYISDEAMAEANRAAVQRRLYGTSITSNNQDSSMGMSFGPNNGISSFTPLTSPVSASGFPLGGQVTGRSATFPGAFSPNGSFATGTSAAPGFGSVGAGSVFTPNGGFFNPFGFGGAGAFGMNSLFGGPGALFGGAGSLFGNAGTFNPYFSLYGNYMSASSSHTLTKNESLANGVGDEGRMKAAMAAAIANQAMPASQAQAQANLQAARAAVRRDKPYVTVQLRNGTTRHGTLKEKNNDWMVLRDGPDEHYIRYNDIVRMTKSEAPSFTRTTSR